MKTLSKIGICAFAVVAMMGCATGGGGGMSDEDAVAMIADKWEEAIKAEDISVSIDYYSDNYEDAESGNKEEYQEWISGIMEQGFLEGAEVDRSDAEITIDGDEATYGPIDLSSDAGGWTIDIMMAKEAEGWKIVSTEVY